MKHTMKSVMSAIEKARTEGGQRLPVLTSNQCHALAQELNKIGSTESYSAGCCCPPKGHQGLWGAGMCPVHQGLRRISRE